MYLCFAGASEYLPSADKWLLHIYYILFANTSLERYVLRKQTVLIAQILCTKIVKVRKAAKIRNRYNQVPHLIQDTTNKSPEVSPFPAGDHNAATYRRESMANTRHK